MRRAVGADRQLLGDVVDDPLVGGGRRGQHRDVRPQPRQGLADAPVVGPEVVAPVGDAVGLVDDEQPDARGERRQQAVAEVRVVEPLRADEQHVDRAGAQRLLDDVPLLGVRRVDGVGRDAGAAPPPRPGCASAPAAATRSASGRRPAPAAARWPRSRPPTCPTRCAARRAPAGGRRRAPRSPPTGRRAAPRRRARRAPAGSSRRLVSWRRTVQRGCHARATRAAVSPERPGPIAGTRSARTAAAVRDRCSLVARERRRTVALSTWRSGSEPLWRLGVHTAFTIGT